MWHLWNVNFVLDVYGTWFVRNSKISQASVATTILLRSSLWHTLLTSPLNVDGNNSPTLIDVITFKSLLFKMFTIESFPPVKTLDKIKYCGLKQRITLCCYYFPSTRTVSMPPLCSLSIAFLVKLLPLHTCRSPLAAPIIV